MEDTTQFSAKLSKLGAECGKAATSSRGCTEFACEPVVSQPIAQMTRMLILRGGDHLQSWAPGHEHPQHVFTALAHLVETGESLPRASQRLRRVRT
jgi:hypothetical protein